MRKKMNQNNCLLAACSLATVLLLSGTSALAQDFTTDDSVMTLTLPDKEGWEQVEDSHTWMTLSNGTDRITLLHYRNGEPLPAITIADQKFSRTCQSILSTRNEVFIITGSAAKDVDFDEIEKAVQSAVINQYDTKTAVPVASSGTSGSSSANTSTASGESESPDTTGTESDTSGYTIKDTYFTGWVTASSLNVHRTYDTSSTVEQTLAQGSEITIDGIVQYNGVDTGWYRLHGGSCGYLLADYVSTTPITAETLGITLTDERHTLRTYDDSQRTYIWKATDGNWYDGSGQQYVPISDTDWICKASGSSSNWTLIPDDSSLSDSQVSNTVTISDEDGLNAQTLYHDSATGNWYNIAGGIYTDNGDGTFTGSDGAIWTVTP